MLFSVLQAMVRPSVLSFPASMPRYAILVTIWPVGQLNVPPDGLRAWLLPEGVFVLSKEFGVLNALPSETVVVQLCATAVLMIGRRLSCAGRGSPEMGSSERSSEHKLTAANADRFFIENVRKGVNSKYF